MSGKARYRNAGELPEEVREPLADLLLVLADSKRLLGMRYADWILGAPALEAGISCSAMAQDEWGHGRVMYAMLRDLDHDPDALEHEREADAYRSMELLDEPTDEWPGLLALNLLADTALTIQFEALEKSRYEPLQYKVTKLLDEERFHFEHGRGWTRRLGGSDRGREALRESFVPALEASLRWFGPDGDERSTVLLESGIADAGPDELRDRWLARVGPVLKESGLDLVEWADGRWLSDVEPDWDGWRSEARRVAPGGPDPETLARVRGDRNRDLVAG